MLSGSVTQYPLTTTTATNTTTATTLATKSRDLDSIAASYESVTDVKTNRKPAAETTSGETGTGNGGKNGPAPAVEVGCDWVVSPGWKLRRRVANDAAAAGANQLPVQADRKSINGDDRASSGGQPENVDDIRSHSALGTEISFSIYVLIESVDYIHCRPKVPYVDRILKLIRSVSQVTSGVGTKSTWRERGKG